MLIFIYKKIIRQEKNNCLAYFVKDL